LTVEAEFSKHRRKDVLPLHPELVVMLRDWLRGMAPGEKLFPKLATAKTGAMLRKDLDGPAEFETAEGVADFHAAGRHSHITELLRNGATLPEAMKLARHSDIKMTMKYTHIGIADQAKAVGTCVPVRSGASQQQTNVCGRRGVVESTNLQRRSQRERWQRSARQLLALIGR